MTPTRVSITFSDEYDDAPTRAFLGAASAAPLAEVLQLLEQGADLRAISHSGATALLLAARNNDNLSVAHYLMEQGLSATDYDDDGNAALHEFARRGADVLLRLALAGGAVVDMPSCWGSPLIVAADAGLLSTVRLLLDAGASCTAVDEHARTALHLVSTRPVIDALVNAGAQVEARNSIGATPLMVHARRGAFDECAHLLALGARIDARDQEGDTALHGVFDPATIELLLGAGADINAMNKSGDSALSVHIKSDDDFDLFNEHQQPDASAAECLIRAGADLNIVGQDGKNALVHAADKSNIAVFLLLLDAGAQPTAALEPIMRNDPPVQQAYAAWRARQSMQAALPPGCAPPASAAP